MLTYALENVIIRTLRTRELTHHCKRDWKAERTWTYLTLLDARTISSCPQAPEFYYLALGHDISARTRGAVRSSLQTWSLHQVDGGGRFELAVWDVLTDDDAHTALRSMNTCIDHNTRARLCVHVESQLCLQYLHTLVPWAPDMRTRVLTVEIPFTNFTI